MEKGSGVDSALVASMAVGLPLCFRLSSCLYFGIEGGQAASTGVLILFTWSALSNWCCRLSTCLCFGIDGGRAASTIAPTMVRLTVYSSVVGFRAASASALTAAKLPPLNALAHSIELD